MGGPRGKASFYTVVGLLCLCSIAAADTHWANVNGSNTPPYSSYATGAHEIQDAVDAAIGGDTIRIAAGLFRPDTTIFLKDSIAVIGAGHDSTVIIPSKEGTQENHPPIFKLQGPSGGAGGGLTLKGCTIRDFLRGPGDTPERLGIRIDLKSTTPNYIIDNAFRFCRQGIVASYVNLELANNLFDSNSTAMVLSFGGPFDVHHNTIIGRPFHEGGSCGRGIDAGSWPLVGPAKIHHNTIATCRGGGISAKGVDDSILIHNNLIVTGGLYGVWMFCYCDALILRNNIIIRTAPDSTSEIAYFTPELPNRIVVENNVFMGKDGIVQVFYDNVGGTIRFAHNDLWGLDSGSGGIPGIDYESGLVVDTVGNLFRDPMFTRDSSYWLQRGSPLIDAGNPLVLDLDLTRSDMGWVGGPEGVIYAYPELPPQRPDTLLASCQDDVVTLSWPRNTEADLAGYRIYRGTVSDFYNPEISFRYTLGLPDTAVVDSFCPSAEHLYYVVTAFDTAGMESGPSPEGAIHLTGILNETEQQHNIPRTPGIIAAYPNPFNSSITIEYYLPDIGTRPTQVQLCIYDVLGRKVTTVVNDRLLPGHHRTSWAGRTDGGTPAGSGVYFAKLTLWGYEFASSAKLVLQK